MTRRSTLSLVVATIVCAGFSGPLAAADAQPPADAAKPVTTPRVGGSPADAEFRAAQQAMGKRYRDARASCRTQPSAERAACVKTARAELRKAQAEAKAAHDAAKRAR
jgi:hypothetical protein